METRTRRILLVSAIGLALIGPGIVEWVRLFIRQRQLDRQIARLSVQQEQLQHEREQLESDPTYVEGLIRSTFKLAQPGEYVIPLDSKSSSGEHR